MAGLPVYWLGSTDLCCYLAVFFMPEVAAVADLKESSQLARVRPRFM